MADKRERDPFSNRYGQSEDTPAETEGLDDSKGSKTSKDSKTPLRQRTNINMYIEDEGLIDELQLRYKKLDLEWQEKHGEDLPKNDRFYPAVLRAALNETSIEEELDID